MHLLMSSDGKLLRRHKGQQYLIYYPEKKFKQDNLLFVNFDE
jgi:hypothetical protein